MLFVWAVGTAVGVLVGLFHFGCWNGNSAGVVGPTVGEQLEILWVGQLVLLWVLLLVLLLVESLAKQLVFSVCVLEMAMMGLYWFPAVGVAVGAKQLVGIDVGATLRDGEC